MEYYVDANAKGEQIGTKEHPFRWINDAAKVACAGDVVYVLPGEYREKSPSRRQKARRTERSSAPRSPVTAGSRG